MHSFYTMDECYRILGLDPKNKYSPQEIKKAYHDKAIIFHPDKNLDDPLASDIFLKIKEAFEVISNPSFAYKKLSSSSELNLIINFKASFNEGFFGKKYEFIYNRSADLIDKYKLSLKIDPVSFDLPQGSSGVYEQHFPEKGFKLASIVGDLLIRVTVAPHKIFILQEGNVISNVNVPLSYFLKGGKMDVPTMYGFKEIKVKPGTKPGSSINIPNCGVASKNYHIAVLNVIFPTEQELKTGEWAKLDIDWGEE